jgi:hypothetical protein
VDADIQDRKEVPMRKALRVGATIAAFALTAWIGVVALAQSSPTQAPTTSTTVSDGDQFKGPCDEAEHANDPECVGATLVAEDNEADDDADDQGENENADDQGDDNDDQGENEQGDDNDDQGENEQGDDNGVDLNDDQGDDNDDQGENEDNDDQGENDDNQGDNDDQGEDGNSGPSENSGPGGDQGEND